MDFSKLQPIGPSRFLRALMLMPTSSAHSVSVFASPLKTRTRLFSRLRDCVFLSDHRQLSEQYPLSFVIVDAVNRMSIAWLVTHVVQERFERRTPPLTDGDASSSVAVPSFVVRVRAAGDNCGSSVVVRVRAAGDNCGSSVVEGVFVHSVRNLVCLTRGCYLFSDATAPLVLLHAE
jgi:hypothetical protein